MNDLHNRFRSLDDVQAPDLWHEAEARAQTLEQRGARPLSLALILMMLLLALAVGSAALVGSGVIRLPALIEDSANPSSTPASESNSNAPSANPTTQPAGWTATGSLTQERQRYTATLLADGNVLVAGGDTTSAELYDPVSGTWTATGTMVTVHYGPAATRLTDGRVLVAGGGSASAPASASAELYDPASGTWSATGNMVSAWGTGATFTATVLADGRVLVAGYGGDNPDLDPAPPELYDPASGTWTATGNMVTPRYGHTATLLADGKVLVAGGGCCGKKYLDSAELFDPDSGTWTATGSMVAARGGSASNSASGAHSATRLADGRVLVVGGMADSGGRPILASAELYDPGTGTWTATGSMGVSRLGHIAALLPDGRVLVGGGYTSYSPEVPVASAELYDPSTGTWTATANLLEAQAGAAVTVLSDGTVLIVGGYDATGTPLTSAELYDRS